MLYAAADKGESSAYPADFQKNNCALSHSSRGYVVFHTESLVTLSQSELSVSMLVFPTLFTQDGLTSHVKDGRLLSDLATIAYSDLANFSRYASTITTDSFVDVLAVS